MSSKKKKILVLGCTGMLGHAVSEYFSKQPGYYVVHTYRESGKPNIALAHVIDDVAKNDDGREQNSFLKFNIDTQDPYFLEQLPSDFDYVINCIGCVKQKDYDLRTYLSVNTQFPKMLATWCDHNSTKLIHITTDCVFSGLNLDEGYSENDRPDCEDIYGISKELGEPWNCLTLRTSIIGREVRANYSLMEWAISQKGKVVDGYVNHIWNGVTNFQYAKICDTIIKDNLWQHGLFHVFSTPVSKFEMLNSFNEKFDLGLTVNPYVHDLSINRRLTTIHDFNSKLNIPSYHDMIKEI